MVIDGKEELRYYNFVYQPYYENGSDKTASGIFSVAHDVTEQVLARKKIEEVKEQLNFRNALYEAQNDVTPDGILIVDAKGRILLHNKRFVEIWKMPQEIIDSNDDHAALDHAKTQLKDPDAFIDRVNYLYARQNDQSDEQILFKDGRVIERKGTPIVAKNGSYYGWAWYFRDVTDRLRQEQKFRNLVEQAAQPILILKGDELVLEVANEALFKLWKVGPDALNKPFLELLPEMKGQVFVDLLHNVMKTGEPFYGFETPAIFKRKDSMEETVYFNFSCQPYRERDGSITGVLVLATDVTEQVATKRQLIESEIRFRNIMQQAPVAFTLTRGEEVVIESVNPPMLKMIGKEKEEDVLGKAMVDVLPEVKDQRFLAIAKNVFSTGEPFRGNEIPVTLRIDGKLKERFFNVSYTPLVEGRKVTGVLHVAIDVTEQVAARKKIQEAEERARLAIESAELGTYEINLQNNVAIMSPRMASIFDVEDSADWNRYITAIHPEDLKLREEAYQKAYKNGVLDYQVRLVRKDGSMRWTRVKGKIYFDHENTPIRLLGVVQDITEQKEFSEALSKKVEERTRELAQANQHLASMNKELEQFTYAASHDMQEPLRKVQTFSSFLLQHHSAQLDDRGKNYLTKIDSSVNRMKVIIDDLLNYSHQTREAQQFVQTDLNKIIEQIEADLELVILQKNATIQKDILPEIAAVPSQMNQLFYNLFSNALKFSKPDVPVKIEIRVEFPSNEEISKKGLSAQRSYLKINFTDNGIGFAQEYAEQIFSLFKRLHGRTEYEGTGIGLGLCKKIVQNHSGAIWAESASQEGAVFHILLPL